MLSSGTVKSFARSSGIHAVGWFPATDFDQYLAAIRERAEYHEIVYRPLSAFLQAGHAPEGVRTIIVVVMDYFVESSDLPDGYRLTNYVRACWPTVSPKTNAMVDFLTKAGHQATPVDVPQRAAACRAGLGFIGRNSMFYAHGLGSYVGISAIGTEQALKGENALVTGGAKGYGRGIAMKLKEKGCEVWITGCDEAVLLKVSQTPHGART